MFSGGRATLTRVTPAQRRWLLAILLVALLVRVAWAAIQPRSAAAVDRLPDQREYLTLADGLLHHASLQLYDARFDQTVFAYRLPAYPTFVAACGVSVPVVRLAQVVIDTTTVLAAFVLARQLSGVPAGLAAAAIIAVNPFYLYFSGLILTETLFAAALAWGTVAACRRALPGMIVCFAVATYLRPTGLVLAPVVVALATNRNGRRAYHRFAPLLVLGCLCIALLPWVGRNVYRLAVPVWTTTNDGITLYDGFHDGATGGSDQRFVADLPGLRSMNEVARSRDLSRRAWQWAVGHPKQLVGLTLRKIARGWSPVPLSQDFGRPLYRWVGGGYAVPFDLLCLIGLASPRLSGGAKRLLVAPAVVLTLVQAVTVGSIRYRMPAEAELAVLAGVGLTDAWRWLRRSNGSPDATAGLHPPSPV